MAAELSALKHWRFHIDFESIAWAVFDQQGESANTLGQETMRELEAIVTRLEDAAKRGEARGVVFMSGKDSGFIAGADIREFENLTREADVEAVVKAGTAILDRIERLPIPAVAAIHGFCVGGGLEFAMACHYRIATREDNTRLGLPEVKLGIIPGLHGTVRFTKLAGAMDAMPAMLTGRLLRASAARAIGLVDSLVATRHELKWAGRRAVLQKRKSLGRPVWWKRQLTAGPARSYLAKKMREETAAKVREEHYPAPFRLIELFEKFGGDPKRMAVAETRYFTPLMVSEQSRNLRRVFKLSEMLKAEAPRGLPKPRRVHVVGAGTMGGDIAAVCVASGMEVSLQDTTKEAVDKAIGRAKSYFKKRMRGATEVDVAMARLHADVDGDHVNRADVIIEAIYENLEAKQKLFQALEAKAKPDAVLATNTSSIPIEQIASALKDPARLIGLHFFNPVPQLPLVEVIRGPQSREDDIRKGCAFVTAIDKYPLICNSCPGFMVNRVLAPYMFGALTRVQAGVPKEKIDQAALKFGMPMGPVELVDVVGLDVAGSVAKILGASTSQNSELTQLISSGKLGKKSGEGFYKWVDGKPQKAEAQYDALELEALGRELVKPLIDECERAVADGIVESADHADAGVIFGTGFAPFRGGPLHYRASLGQPRAETRAEAA
ncbi:MAG: 3-hydroxyacyl-CoA dehydrogenase NAD-binding domain-containing protein [Hyphomicrobiales bacterium]|nr:3-hydroxyacyl-CoA dehydrogenase NAD-binding domain-containing protein [Hyphomicrobiales bacterium]